MNIKKNTEGTYDLTNVSLGKLMAIVNAINRLHVNNSITVVQDDVRNIINNNPEYIQDCKV